MANRFETDSPSLVMRREEIVARLVLIELQVADPTFFADNLRRRETSSSQRARIDVDWELFAKAATLRREGILSSIPKLRETAILILPSSANIEQVYDQFRSNTVRRINGHR